MFLLAAASMSLAAAPVETIVVTGQPLARADGSQPFSGVTLMGAILDPASGRAEDALRAVGGVQLFRRSSTRTANPTAEGLTARGLSGNAATRMPVMLDGIPLADPFFGSVSWTALGARPVESARVERGIADPAAGPGAVAGSAMLESSVGPDMLVLRGGSRGSVDAAVLVDLAAGAGRISVAGSYARGDGHRLVDETEAGRADRAARYAQYGGNIRALAPLGAETELQATLAAFDDRRLRGAPGAEIVASGADAGVRVVHRGRWQAEAAAWGQIRDFATTIVGLSADRGTATPTLDQVATPSTGVGARLDLRPPPVGALRLRMGGDVRAAMGQTRERFRFIGGQPTRERRAGGRQATAGAFLNASAVVGAVTLSAAGRLDHWKVADGQTREIDRASGLPTLDIDAADRSGIAWSGRAGVAWQPVPAFSIGVAASRAFRVPTLNELHRPFRVGNVFTDANPALDPEVATTWQASARFEPLSTARGAVTLFHTRLADAVANVTVGQGPGVFPGVGFLPAGGLYRQRRNLSGITSRGAEADVAIGVGAYTLGASVALVDARVDGGALVPALTGRRPAQSPRMSGALSLDWRGPWARIGAVLSHSSAQFEDDLNERRLAPATQFDVTAAVPIAPRLSLHLAAENLLDAAVESGFSGALVERGQPRTLWLGIVLQPGGGPRVTADGS